MHSVDPIYVFLASIIAVLAVLWVLAYWPTKEE
jgi:hypothetical protein